MAVCFFFIFILLLCLLIPLHTCTPAKAAAARAMMPATMSHGIALAYISIAAAALAASGRAVPRIGRSFCSAVVAGRVLCAFPAGTAAASAAAAFRPLGDALGSCGFAPGTGIGFLPLRAGGGFPGHYAIIPAMP